VRTRSREEGIYLPVDVGKHARTRTLFIPAFVFADMVEAARSRQASMAYLTPSASGAPIATMPLAAPATLESAPSLAYMTTSPLPPSTLESSASVYLARPAGAEANVP
jgi:hypothetical protein